jgi:hypothetical protein
MQWKNRHAQEAPPAAPARPQNAVTALTGTTAGTVSNGQARLNTSVPFVPPNPNEFFSATSIFISRAVFAQ